MPQLIRNLLARPHHRRCHIGPFVLALVVVAVTAPAAVVGAALPAGAQEAAPGATPANPVDCVAVRQLEPFIMRNGDTYRGFSAALWDEVAKEAGIDPGTFVEVSSVNEMLDAVRSGRCQAAVTAISVTSAREATVDFTVPMLDSGLQAMVPKDDGIGFTDALRRTLSGPVLALLGLLLLGVLFMGTVVWAIERRSNPDFRDRTHHGVLDGIWWAAVTLMTVGYGDKVPRTAIGRTITIVWMIIGIIFVAQFTATVTAQLTVSELEQSATTIDDLYGKDVVAVSGTTSSAYLDEIGLTHRDVPTVDDGFRAVTDQAADAFIYDGPVLDYYASHAGRGKVTVLPTVLRPEYYGIAVGQGSPLRDQLNDALLQLRESGAYDNLVEDWFEATK